MTGPVVYRSYRRPDPAMVVELGRLGVATTHEAMGRTGLLGAELRPVYPGTRLAGRAVTVESQAGDNLMIHVASELCEPGDVLMVGLRSPSTDGMFGELLATALRAQGVVGIVIDAGVRDVAELTAIRFPAWARAVSAQGTVKATAGSVNIPVVIAGGLVNPGDVVLADDDGVVVVPYDDVDEAVAEARTREANEDKKRRQLASGTPSLDLFGLRPMVADLGIRYVDGPPSVPANARKEPDR